jgi:hypothetical protein
MLRYVCRTPKKRPAGEMRAAPVLALPLGAAPVMRSFPKVERGGAQAVR